MISRLIVPHSCLVPFTIGTFLSSSGFSDDSSFIGDGSHANFTFHLSGSAAQLSLTRLRKGQRGGGVPYLCATLILAVSLARGNINARIR